MISPPLPNLFQVYDSDCCDSILLELREYLPKYFGVWSPPTAPNGTVLFLSVNPNLLEKSSGDWFLAVASSVGFWFWVFFCVLFCNPLMFPLTTGSSLQSSGWIRSLGSSSQGRWGMAVCAACGSWVAGPDAYCPGAAALAGVMSKEQAGCMFMAGQAIRARDGRCVGV